ELPQDVTVVTEQALPAPQPTLVRVAMDPELLGLRPGRRAHQPRAIPEDGVLLEVRRERFVQAPLGRIVDGGVGRDVHDAGTPGPDRRGRFGPRRRFGGAAQRCIPSWRFSRSDSATTPLTTSPRSLR